MLALQFQFDRSQWLAPEQLLAHQFEQLRLLIGHARAQVPFYRDHMQRALMFSFAGVNAASFKRWPILKRADLQQSGQALLARTCPPEHGGLVWQKTSGSTGEPVRFATSALGALFQDALNLRAHLWYGLDFRRKFGSIRISELSAHADDWGSVTRGTFATGPSVWIALNEDVDRQLDWLLREQPAYLMSRGHTLHSLIHASLARGVRPVGLVALLSYADKPPDDLRILAERAWGVPVFDGYSANEVGPIALQCPEHGKLHVQSENLLVEVLREDGSDCAPGEIGRVVITDLHNFAMPMIRYEIGDYAEAGAPCACGRGLPVLARIAGRATHMAVDAAGRRFWPLTNSQVWLDTPVTKRQFVQHSPTQIEVKFVAPRDLTAEEEERIRAGLVVTFRTPFDFSFTRVAAIERAPGAKFEDFISRIPAA